MIKRFPFLFFIGTSCIYAFSERDNYFAGLESAEPADRITMARTIYACQVVHPVSHIHGEMMNYESASTL